MNFKNTSNYILLFIIFFFTSCKTIDILSFKEQENIKNLDIDKVEFDSNIDLSNIVNTSINKKDFYSPFDLSIEKAMKEAERVPRDQIDEETNESCEKCERPMVIKSGRFGRFMSCSGFPECASELVERRQKGRGGKIFYGCSGYPNCSFAVNQKPLPQPCPECGEMLVASGRENARCLTCKYKGPVQEEIPEDNLQEVTVP